MRRARGIEGARRAPPCEARDLGTAAPERFWHKNRQWERTRLPRRLRAQHGAPPRVQAFRCHCMCMLWYEGSGRAVRPRRGHKFFGFGDSSRVGAQSVRRLAAPRAASAARGARHRAAHSHAMTSPLPARGAKTPRGARGAPACLGWARRTAAGRRRRGSVQRRRARAPCTCMRAASSTKTGPRGART